MRNIIKYYIILLLLLLLLAIFISNCKKEKIDIENIGFELKAIGSHEMDEEKWGNFSLVLELEKSTFLKDESCITQLSFVNCGKKEIILDGILPYRQSANEPFIYLNSDDGEYYRIDTLLEEICNEELIIVKVDSSVKLMKFNLTDVRGLKIIENNDGFSVSHKEIRLVDELKPGKYYISASFYPTPQVYTGITDTLVFSIE